MPTITSEQLISLNELNLTKGVSKTIMDHIVEYKHQEYARGDSLHQWENAFQQQAINNYNLAMKMTTSILFNAG